MVESPRSRDFVLRLRESADFKKILGRKEAIKGRKKNGARANVKRSNTFLYIHTPHHSMEVRQQRKKGDRKGRGRGRNGKEKRSASPAS